MPHDKRDTGRDKQRTDTPSACPACGATQVAPIMYGLPLYSAFEASQRGEIVLGGCVSSGVSPRWACQTCGARFSLSAPARRSLLASDNMRDYEILTTPDLVRHMLAQQFPQWADLPVARVASSGTSNALYRLGDDLVARLPLDPLETGQVEKEWLWLPLLAPHLPLAVPTLLGLGERGAVYQQRWLVCRWLEGQEATREALGESVQAARDLAAFIRALRAVDATGGPKPGLHNFGRGEPLAARDAEVRESLAALRATLPGDFDWQAAEAAWDESLDAPVWDRPPVWIHGDLYAANLLAREGRLSAVIDFGGLGVGDPAVDLMPAWNLFSGAARAAFREALQPDGAMWLRGRGWALSMSLIALPYYLHTNPAMAALSRATIAEVLGDYQRAQ